MMNAAEARQLTRAYFNREICRHLDLIQIDVKHVANDGGWRCRYSHGISGARPEVRDAVMNSLIEGGFNAEWVDGGSAIVINWEDK